MLHIGKLNSLLLLWLSLLPAMVNAAEVLPSQSVFNSEISVTGQTGAALHLSDNQGRMQLVAFVYTHCTSVCPVIMADLMRLDAQMSPALRSKTLITLISLDPAMDTPEVMQAFLTEHGIKDRRWRFVRSSPDDLQELALLFDMRYRRDEKEIAHSNMLSLLDANGVLLHQRRGNTNLDELLNIMNKNMSGKTAHQ